MRKFKDFIYKYYPIILIVIFAFVLRMLFFKKNFFFGFEQGSDFLKLREILAGDLTLIGPKTDIDGVFHGAFSLYGLLPPFVFFNGNPYLVQVFNISLSSISIFFLYQFVKDLFNKNVALISSFLYSISYSAIIYARWQSDLVLVPPLTILLIFILNLSKKKSLYLPVGAFIWSLIFHQEMVVAIILIPGIIFYLFSQKIKLDAKILFLCIFVCLLVFSPYILFDLRHNHILVRGILNLFTIRKSISSVFSDPFVQFKNEIVDGFYPASRNFALILFGFFLIATVIQNKLKRNNELFLILIFLFTGPLFYLLIGIYPLRHFYIYVPIFLSIFAAFSIGNLLKSRFALFGIGLISIILIGNLITLKDRLPKSIANFIHHAQHTYLYDEMKLLDYVYEDANGKEFSYDYYSIPYWKNEAWEYLFSWYGKSKYGYLPSYDRTSIFYVLIEPDESQPLYQENWYEKMNQESKLLNTYTSGYLKVEKRLLTD